MKITYIISEIDKAVFFEQTAFSLKKEGVDVQFILINCENGALVNYLEQHSFNYFLLTCPNLRKSWSTITACKKELLKNRPDIIHCHLSTANWVGLWAGKLARIRHRIYTRHSGKPLFLGKKEKIIDFIQNKLATKIVAISENIVQLLINQGVASSKIELVPHGFQLQKFSENDFEAVERIKDKYNSSNQFPVIGVVARWLELKGIQFTIDAFLKLLEHYPNAVLCLFNATGNDPYKAKLLEKLERIPAQNKQIVGFEKNVFDLYQLFDVYVHVPINTTCEAFGQTYVEALASGRPSVFTWSGIATSFIKDRENALVVPFNDSNAIYDSLVELLENQELAKKITLQGKKDVFALFNFSTYIQTLMSIYNSTK